MIKFAVTNELKIDDVNYESDGIDMFDTEKDAKEWVRNIDVCKHR